MRAAMTLGALVALAACGVPEAEDVQASRGAIQGLYFVPFDPDAVEKSDSWNEMLEEYAKN